MSDDKTYPYIEWNDDPCNSLPHRVEFGAGGDEIAWVSTEQAHIIQFGIDHTPQDPLPEGVRMAMVADGGEVISTLPEGWEYGAHAGFWQPCSSIPLHYRATYEVRPPQAPETEKVPLHEALGRRAPHNGGKIIGVTMELDDRRPVLNTECPDTDGHMVGRSEDGMVEVLVEPQQG